MRDNRISITGLLYKFGVVIGFVLLLMWISPMKDYDVFYPLLDQIYSDNIDRMRIAAKSYYTSERMPEELNDKKEISLATMVDSNLVIPLIDKEGNECDLDESYVSVVKMSTEYIMTVNLKCGEQEDFIIEYVGCYDVCTTPVNCETDDMIAYLYKRTVTETKSNSVCPVGYTLSGGSCYKTTTAGTYKDAIEVALSDIKESVAAEKVYEDGEVIYYDAANRYTTVYVDKIASTTTTGGESYTCTKYKDSTCTRKVDAVMGTKKEAVYTTSKEAVYKTSKEAVYTTSKEPVYTTKQEAVYKTVTVPVYSNQEKCTVQYVAPCTGCAPVATQVCSTVSVQTGTTTKQEFSHYETKSVFSHYESKEVFSHYETKEVFSHYETKEVFSHYEYVDYVITPATTETYTCQEAYTTTCTSATGTATTYSCPSGTTDNGSNCKKEVFEKADCNDVDGSTAVGNAYVEDGLQCAINSGSTFSHYDCSNFGTDAVLIDKENGICEITKPGGVTYTCEDGSDPVDGLCYYGTTTTDTVKPTVNTWTESSVEYKWSIEPNLEGWEKVKKSEYNL